MPADWSVRAEGLSKKFGLTLRQSMRYGLRDSLRRLAGRRAPTDVLRPGEFWAVRDVSFELKPGDSLGIMGVNGSGKTTLLRILNGTYAPDTGAAMLRGRVGALIAAGAGFAPMLTGRENVFVNGALLGMSRREVKSKMEEIADFAAVGDFMDMPVKHYSSGMYVRLGFAIAAMSEPDVLLVDEVLAVGDLNFQKKCFDYLFRLKRQGTSIVLVSHSVGAIWAVCDRGIFMHEGQVKVAGAAEDVIRAYDEQNYQGALQGGVSAPASSETAGTYGHARGGTGDIFCNSVTVRDAETGAEGSQVQMRQPVEIGAEIHVTRPVEKPLLRITVDAIQYKFIAVLDSYEQGLSLDRIDAGTYRLVMRVDDLKLRPGAYVVNVGISQRHLGAHLFYWFGAARFVVCHPRDRFLYADSNAIVDMEADFSLEALGADVQPEAAGALVP